MHNESLQTFISCIQSQQVDKLPALYIQLNDAEATQIQKFCYQQAESNDEIYRFFQDLSSQLIISKGTLPEGLITGINTLNRLIFFSNAISSIEGYAQTNRQGNTLLHALLANSKQTTLPYNYLRSLMLFERNESLSLALAKKNEQKMRPIDCYLAYNDDLAELPDHELSALLTLIEIQSKSTQDNDPHMLNSICRLLVKKKLHKKLHNAHQRVLLIASSFLVTTSSVCKLLDI